MIRKNLLSALLALTMLLCVAASASAQETDPFLAQLEGTYDELFTVICAPEYDELWLASCAKYAGEEDAQLYADLLKGMCVATIYGEEAIAAYAEDPESIAFDCFFIGGVAQFTFAGNEISGTDADDNTVFAHTYSYVGEDADTGFALYQSDEAADDGFTYFLMAPDTPAETFHIEFRYGDNLDDLSKYYEGEYAYWLAAGIESGYTQETIEQVIDLFCMENLTEE